MRDGTSPPFNEHAALSRKRRRHCAPAFRRVDVAYFLVSCGLGVALLSIILGIVFLAPIFLTVNGWEYSVDFGSTSGSVINHPSGVFTLNSDHHSHFWSAAFQLGSHRVAVAGRKTFASDYPAKLRAFRPRVPQLIIRNRVVRSVILR